jgi:hypothetical protein
MATSSARAEDTKNQAAWDKLKKLSAGQEIQVVQNGAKSTTGNFRSVTDEAIVVSTATGEQSISRQSVLRVSSKGSGHRVRNTLIGAGIGAGAGAGIGAAVGGCGQGVSCIGASKGEVIGVITGVGAIVGAIVGAVLPTGGWHEIYRAR